MPKKIEKDGEEVLDENQNLDDPEDLDDANDPESDNLDEGGEGDGKAKKDKKIDNEIDYKAELAREKERADKAEAAIAEDAFKKRTKKRKGQKEEEVDEEDDSEDDKPITARQLTEILRQNTEQTRKEVLSDQILVKAKALAKSDEEAEYIVAIHKNRSFPAGMSLDEQLEEAYAIANRKRIMGQNSELRRALRSKDTVSKDGASAHRDPLNVSEPRSSNELTALKAAGFIWDAKTGFYKKSVGGGKRILYHNPRTKKSWSEIKK